MKITISHYGSTVQWSNKYREAGRRTPVGPIDETSPEEAIDAFAALLVACGFHLQTIKDTMYDYGRKESPEEV